LEQEDLTRRAFTWGFWGAGGQTARGGFMGMKEKKGKNLSSKDKRREKKLLT